MHFRVLVVLIAWSCVSSSALKINCEYGYRENCVRNCYQCTFREIIITKQNQTISDINGKHVWEESPADVQTIKAFEQHLAYIPSNLHQHFPFLSVLKVWSCGLRSLEQRDIRNLKYLTDLSVSGNRLETLRSDLFVFNQRLITVDFTRNRLRHIGTNFLKPLKNLVVADFYQNDCISDGGRYQFEELSLRLRRKCQPSPEMVVEELDVLSKEIELLKSEIEVERKKLKFCTDERQSHAQLDSLFPSIVIDDHRWDGQ